MNEGIIISNACRYTEHYGTSEFEKEIKNLDSIALELDYIKKIKKKLSKRCSLIAMISYYFGAKTLNIKKEEIKFAVDNGADELVIFFDLINIKFKDYKMFENEIGALQKIAHPMDISLFVPIELLSGEELNIVLNYISNKNINKIFIGEVYGNKWYPWKNSLKKIKNKSNDFEFTYLIKNKDIYKNNKEYLENIGIKRILYHL